jgi:polysaccharide pyruvyl transferase WcaK-like protein
MGFVYVVGYFGASNLGDDLLLVEAMNEILEVVDYSKVVIVSHPNNYLSGYYPKVTQITPSKFIRLRLSSEDKIVFAGGGQFSNFNKPNISNIWGLVDLLSIIGIRFLFWHTFNGVQGFPFLIGVGPIRGVGGKVGLWLLGASLESGSVRDSISRSYLKKCIEGFDPVLASKKVKRIKNRCNEIEPQKIGILVRNWGTPVAVEAFSTNLISFLRNQGYSDSQIVIISFQEKYDYAIYSLPVFEPFELLVWRPELNSPNEFIQRLSTLDHLFSMRAHGIYLAARLNLSVTPVIIEQKISIAASQIGLSDPGVPLDCQAEDFFQLNLFQNFGSRNFLTSSDNTICINQLRFFLSAGKNE